MRMSGAWALASGIGQISRVTEIKALLWVLSGRISEGGKAVTRRW